MKFNGFYNYYSLIFIIDTCSLLSSYKLKILKAIY